MLDAGLRVTFRNFATLFFLVAAVTIPLHIAYSFVFRNVIAVSDLRADIERFPSQREVRSVGRTQIGHADLAAEVIAGIEIALLPLAVGAATRVLEADERGDLPEVPRAWATAAGAAGALWRGLKQAPGTLLGALVVAAAAGVLIDRIGALVAEPIPATYRFLGVGLSAALARAVAAPLLLGPAALAGREKVPDKNRLPGAQGAI
jgi:hypothetical protein